MTLATFLTSCDHAIDVAQEHRQDRRRIVGAICRGNLDHLTVADQRLFDQGRGKQRLDIGSNKVTPQVDATSEMPVA